MIVPARSIGQSTDKNTNIGLLGILTDGAPKGSTILLSGGEGCGKSTILMQSLAIVAQHSQVLYISGEESPVNVRDRMARLNIPVDCVFIHAKGEFVDLALVLENAKKDYNFAAIVVDSLQTSFVAGAPEGPIGDKAVITLVREYCKQTDCIGVIVSQVNIDGTYSGTRAIGHGVDATMELSQDRLLVVKKCRWNKAPVQIQLTMTQEGLAYGCN